VVVVGAGITGLAAAHRLTELAPDWRVLLLEAADRPGGVLCTEPCGGYLLEHSADSFLSNVPEALALCRRVGLEEALVGTRPEARRAFVVRRGRLVPIPEGFSLMAPARVWPLLATPLLSWRGKLRVLGEWFVPPRRDGVDESLAEFACRRLGREAFERLVQPLVAGIYTSAAEKLSVAAALPRFVELEQRYGSVARGLRREARAARARAHPSAGTGSPSAASAGADDVHAAGARYGLFVTPREGLSSLVAAVAARLPPSVLRTQARVQQIRRMDGGWELAVQNGPPLAADALILAVAAPEAARLLSGLHPALESELRGIEYAGTTLVLLGYARQAFPSQPRGSGFVVPAIEQRRILAASFASEKFPGRAPADRVLVRVFVGGATQPHLMELGDEEVVALAERELAELLGVRGQPELVRVIRWRRQMPQYQVGHLARVQRIEAHLAELPGLLLAGNAYHGVGIPYCIRSGERAAEQAVQRLRAS
jgi:oxygen-dependent protoporphyrinogen oxidase